MQGVQREEATEGQFGPDGLRLELPGPLLERARVILGPLFERSSASEPADSLAVEPLPAGAPTVRVEANEPGWRIRHGASRQYAEDEEALLLRLQEIGVEIAARRRQWLLIRASLVSRGSQSVMIVDDPGNASPLLAVAITTLGFQPASIGLAAFDPRRLVPLPLPLAFSLAPDEQAMLASLSLGVDERLIRLSPVLFRPRRPALAPEPTHVLFPEPAAGARCLVRPISAAAARARLRDALLFAPDDPPPFAALAALLRPARAVHLALADLSQALELLARLLPQWRLE